MVRAVQMYDVVTYIDSFLQMFLEDVLSDGPKSMEFLAMVVEETVFLDSSRVMRPSNTYKPRIRR